ncbi:MAG: exodeoxyribonuclease VII large subunit [Clostridiaceae bacterium]
MIIKTLSVSEINNYVKKLFDYDYILKNVSIKGEISNLKMHSSGHIYFSLKDENSKINCIMFKTDAKYIKFDLENGINVLVKGRISVYNKEGTYQLYANEIKPDGIGELYLSYEKLKNKLASEGLFDERYKLNIPKYPQKIAVITSPTGAAIRDIINVIKRRNTNVEICIFGALVQGMNGAQSIVNAIEKVNSIKGYDMIILSRGGGSLEELWCFNEEIVAYSIFNSKIPIITGVGHETDFTIADFVSDLRAPTPSAAAELAVPMKTDLENDIKNIRNHLTNMINNIINYQKENLNSKKNTIKLYSPENYIANEMLKIENYNKSIENIIKRKTIIEKSKLEGLNSLLNAHNPLNVLNKGYSLVTDNKNKVVSDVSYLNSLDEINITVKNGTTKLKIN